MKFPKLPFVSRKRFEAQETLIDLYRIDRDNLIADRASIQDYARKTIDALRADLQKIDQALQQALDLAHGRLKIEPEEMYWPFPAIRTKIYCAADFASGPDITRVSLRTPPIGMDFSISDPEQSRLSPEVQAGLCARQFAHAWVKLVTRDLTLQLIQAFTPTNK